MARDSYEKKVAREESLHEAYINEKQVESRRSLTAEEDRYRREHYSRTHNGGNPLGYLIKSIKWVNN